MVLVVVLLVVVLVVHESALAFAFLSEMILLTCDRAKDETMLSASPASFPMMIFTLVPSLTGKFAAMDSR